jgi:prepilin-type N-terminal cleavage/methylation domain-containing protein
MRPFRGFTLVELVTVLMLIGILAVFVGIRFNRAEFDVQVYADELVLALRHAQHMSMTHTGATNWRVVTGGSGFTVQRTNGAAVPDPYSGAPSYSANWPGAAVSTASISFDSRGEPTGATAVNITLGGAHAQVVVEPVTGYAHR